LCLLARGEASQIMVRVGAFSSDENHRVWLLRWESKAQLGHAVMKREALQAAVAFRSL
jgi:hypothetical protein